MSGLFRSLTREGTNTKSSQSSCKLLDLAQELRNNIYRFTIIVSKPIEISSRSKPSVPNLLQVNSQIREESRGIYYSENFFIFVIRDHDSAVFQKWFQNFTVPKLSQHEYMIHPSTNWQNLGDWMKAFYDNKTNGQFPGPRVDGKPHAVTCMFKIVNRMKSAQKLSWEQISTYLEDVHQMLVDTNPAWA